MSERERYLAALHAMQSGVAFLNAAKDLEPKHLRVGVNAAMSDLGGLATLLIEKGIITRDEYEKALADAMEREADSYRQRLAEHYGMDPNKINLS